MRFRILPLIAAAWAVMVTGAAHAGGVPWVLVDTAAHTISVIRNGEIMDIFRHIALGRGGVARLHFEGDGRTPLGTYKVAWINRNSRFHIFFGLNYPTSRQAAMALEHNKIDLNTYYAITKASYNGMLPPQKTELGGFIGIHGLGNGNPVVQRLADWTQGCIAVTNKQIDGLAKWVTLGTKVVIR